MKKMLILCMTLTLFGCSQQTITPSETVNPTTEPTVDIVAPDVPKQTETTKVTVDELPLVSIGIFNNTTNSTEYCIVTVNIYNNTDNYNSIDIKPVHDFYNEHSDLMKNYRYYGKYEDTDGEMLTAMGYTPQNIQNYNLNYYYYYYDVDPSITDEFIQAVHSVTATYSTTEPIDITFFESNIEFNPIKKENDDIEQLTLSFSQYGWDYYLVNEKENLYLKIVDTVNYDVFTIGKNDKLYGMFYQGDVSVDCFHGWFISDSAYTSHGESGGWSPAETQLSDNLRIQPYFLGGFPIVESNSTINEEVNSFNYEDIQLEVIE